MYGIFERFYNHQGERRWKFRGLNSPAFEHTHVTRFGDVTVVTCRIKRHPRIGTYCKAPANYMRPAA